ncbi:hypothetical protein J2X02_001996 [Pseudoxanthomonas japonensis]|jgi:hypothetical protein|uniref:hypothetical protein n=1 Tax=Pseudoxanthomonas TaxID=83618 RepID=UPI0007840675|nr:MULTISPECIES: hypothetical protein [Pseudoxanthomonas]MBA3929962.1 hypothetical protein [Xanthomonas sp.]MDR7069145.1 hypothetical protein [Pseudoxanthomonas japonensis]
MKIVGFLLIPLSLLAMSVAVALRIVLIGELEGRWRALGMKRPPLLLMGDGFAWRLLRAGPGLLTPAEWMRVKGFFAAWLASPILLVVSVLMVALPP